MTATHGTFAMFYHLWMEIPLWMTSRLLYQIVYRWAGRKAPHCFVLPRKRHGTLLSLYLKRTCQSILLKTSCSVRYPTQLRLPPTCCLRLRFMLMILSGCATIVTELSCDNCPGRCCLASIPFSHLRRTHIIVDLTLFPKQN